MKTDTIAAIATALSDSGIGIIRVSGEEAIPIVHKIYRNKENENVLSGYESHTIHYGFIIEKNGDLIDEVMVSVMKAPHSYTTEDTVEINCHGGVLMMKKILMTVIEAGARLAEPGEFTKRAFLNGRIDLSRAEAVMDTIHAKNQFALKSSVKQLRGSVFKKVKELRDNILYEIAFIESALDDPEHISLDGYTERLSDQVCSFEKELNKLLDSADDGKLLKEGIRTVIVGKPNVGKSSLLNLLVGQERAIVTDVAGTTRDTLEETINLGDITLHITDTAGIRSTEDVVEKIGVEKAETISEDADLILYVIDSSIPLDENDLRIIRMIEEKKIIILLNKSDLEEVTDKVSVDNLLSEVMKRSSRIYELHEKKEEEVKRWDEKESIFMIKISAKEREGLDCLVDLIKKMFFHGQISYDDEVCITSARHKEALMEALESIRQVQLSLKNQMPEDFYSIDLMNAYASLGRIIGEEVEDDLVNEIFSKFCMGK
ncbi:MAG TPA: tRNA uridine-5-carboxymethylaminomethyl(34) synthesis GTPase MnmE [Lachnospiraceae bacterium]|nr:tRNA uridine-5-carboxymethylaminomethyl(34) synthesis GTPase MnmE [Lachnospiraceae bacterium]